MQKVILDTNVLISALIQKNYPFLIVSEIIFEKKAILCLSEELLQEYFDVLSRPKFSRYPDFEAAGQSLLGAISDSGTSFNPKKKINLLKDQDDNKILELALVSKANFIITGNTSDFTIETFRGTKIVSPSVYWNKHKPRSR
jgi:uncharacterized protein